MAKSESTKYRLAEAMKTCMKTTSVNNVKERKYEKFILSPDDLSRYS